MDISRYIKCTRGKLFIIYLGTTDKNVSLSDVINCRVTLFYVVEAIRVTETSECAHITNTCTVYVLLLVDLKTS